MRDDLLSIYDLCVDRADAFEPIVVVPGMLIVRAAESAATLIPGDVVSFEPIGRTPTRTPGRSRPCCS